MVAQDARSHQPDGGQASGSRISAAGYTGWNRLARKNIYAYSGSRRPYAHAGFFIDWGFGGGVQSPAGHRNNIMNRSHRRFGIRGRRRPQQFDAGWSLRGHSGLWQPWLYKAQLVRSAADINDGDDFYSMGEAAAASALR